MPLTIYFFSRFLYDLAWQPLRFLDTIAKRNKLLGGGIYIVAWPEVLL